MKKKVLIGVAAVLVVGGIATGAGEEEDPATPAPVESATEAEQQPSAAAGPTDTEEELTPPDLDYIVIDDSREDQVLVEVEEAAPTDEALRGVVDRVIAGYTDRDAVRVQIVCAGTATDQLVGKVVANARTANSPLGSAQTGVDEGEVLFEAAYDLTCPSS